MSRNLYNFSLITLLYYFAAVDCKALPFDYTNHTGVVGQLKLHIVPATWKDALMICDMEGAVLASPSTDAMKSAIAEEMKRADLTMVFTGINSIYSKGYFFSIEGLPLADMPLTWLGGQPDNAGDSEDCIALQTLGSLADVSCSEVMPFVCYRQTAPRSACLKETPIKFFYGSIICGISEFQCTWGGQCIPHSWLCDGEGDCADGSDELDCLLVRASSTLKPGQCHPGEFICSKHVCLPKDKRCDGHNDCLDGSDEVACNKSPNSTGSDQHPCYRFHSDPRTWSEAYRMCAAEGSHLAVINSEREASRIKNDLEFWKQNKTFAIFIGFHDWSGRGDWRTVHGQTLPKAGYDEWAPAGSKIRAERTCGALDRRGRLVSHDCDEVAPFLCERPE